MDLRTVRIQLTAVFTVLSACAVGAIALYAIGVGRDRLAQEAEREVEQRFNAVLLLYGQSGDLEEPAWTVNLADGSSRIVGADVTVEPPLRTLATRAGTSTETVSVERFDYEGDPYLAATRKLVANEDDEQYLITALDISSTRDAADSLRVRVLVAALGLSVACGAVGHAFAKRALEPARRAMAQQRDFIADAAHEMRTPLAVIRASSSHALTREREASEYRASLSEILTAAERASTGVGELLELARLEAGQAEPRLAPLRLDLLLEEVAAAVRVEGVTIVADAGDALVVDADYVLMQQVVENLVRNAASRATRVELTAARRATWAVVTIVDDGPGFDPDVLPHVFDRFRRGDGRGSAGLGLAIAKRIVDAHGGRLVVGNREQGGAVAEVHLALSRG